MIAGADVVQRSRAGLSGTLGISEHMFDDMVISEVESELVGMAATWPRAPAGSCS